MTYFYKVVKVDLDAERSRIKKVRYTGTEKALLRQLCDLIEQHDLVGAVRLTRKWTREQLEYISSPIWDLLCNIAIEQRTPFGRAQLEKEWKRRDKKGEPT